MTCRACGHSATEPVVRIDSVPVLCNVLCETRAEALAVRRGEIRLEYCPACGLIANRAFDEGRVRYHGAYENALHFSPRFRGYAESLARELVEGHGLGGKRIAEIGCGDGSFLATLCDLGAAEGVGYDPAFDASRAGPLPKGVRIEPRLFSREAVVQPPDFVVCRHVLEHIADPLGFLRSVREAMSGNPAAAGYFEVPDAMWTLRERGIWDIIYEHCLYLTPPALRNLMVAAGFRVLEVRSEYGGQFLGIRVGFAAGGDRPGPTAEDREIGGLVDAFAETYRAQVEAWRTRVRALAVGKAKVVVWGAGSKGVMFLNTLAEDAAPIRHVVDVNPRKAGRYIAGSGQKIVPPAELRALRPDVVLLMNPVYREEVGGQLAELGVRAELVTA